MNNQIESLHYRDRPASRHKDTEALNNVLWYGGSITSGDGFTSAEWQEEIEDMNAILSKLNKLLSIVETEGLFDPSDRTDLESSFYETSISQNNFEEREMERSHSYSVEDGYYERYEEMPALPLDNETIPHQRSKRTKRREIDIDPEAIRVYTKKSKFGSRAVNSFKTNNFIILVDPFTSKRVEYPLYEDSEMGFGAEMDEGQSQNGDDDCPTAPEQIKHGLHLIRKNLKYTINELQGLGFE